MSSGNKTEKYFQIFDVQIKAVLINQVNHYVKLIATMINSNELGVVILNTCTAITMATVNIEKLCNLTKYKLK